MKLVLISIALIAIAILVTYLIRKEKKDNQQNKKFEVKTIEIEEELSPESNVAIQEKLVGKKEKKATKRKYTKKNNTIKQKTK